MEELKKLNIFIQDTTRIIKGTSASFLKEKSSTIKANYPTLYADLIYWYDRVFQVKPSLRGCAMTLIEKFTELRVLTEQEKLSRMNLRSKLKADKTFLIDNVYYSSKSKHLTNKVCDQIYAIYGNSVFEFYNESVIEEAEIIEEITDVTLDEMLIDESLLDMQESEVVLDKMTVAQLKEYAKENNIEITSRRRDDIIEEIKSC